MTPDEIIKVLKTCLNDIYTMTSKCDIPTRQAINARLAKIHGHLPSSVEATDIEQIPTGDPDNPHREVVMVPMYGDQQRTQQPAEMPPGRERSLIKVRDVYGQTWIIGPTFAEPIP